MPGGRPTLYDPKFCQMLIDHMAGGLSFESFAGVIGTCRDTLYNWAKEYSEFFDAKKQGFAKNRLYWEKAGNAGMYMGGKENPFNATVWIFNMKNRFGWADRTEQTGTITHKHETDASDPRQVRDMARRVAFLLRADGAIDGDLVEDQPGQVIEHKP